MLGLPKQKTIKTVIKSNYVLQNISINFWKTSIPDWSNEKDKKCKKVQIFLPKNSISRSIIRWKS